MSTTYYNFNKNDALFNSTEQSSFWEVNCFSASQDILRTLYSMKVRYLIHKSPPLIPILSQIKPVHVSFIFLEDQF